MVVPLDQDHRFEQGPTGEMFNRRAEAIILVATNGKRRTVWSLATSAMFFRLSADSQAEVLAELNARLAQIPAEKR